MTAASSGNVATPTNSSLAGRVAVITGAGRGIGRAIALRFASAGAAVGLIARTRGQLDDVAAEIHANGGRAAIAVADVGDAAAASAAVASIRAALGTIDIVVNNAGMVIRRLASELSDADWREVMRVNLDGTFFITRAATADLRARHGRIINIASISGRQGTALLTAYCAAKHGVVGFTRALAEELRADGVTVNAICPGSVDTEMLRQGIPDATPDMSPDDIARTALFLASEAPRALTGACVDVYG